MSVNFMVKMWCILVLCPVLLAAGAQTLSIDSQLGTSIEDCFERISIGEQLPFSAIYRNVSELTTRECEQICKQDKQCQAYDYGVGAKGNATCELSNLGEKELKEKNVLNRHPDYDVYVRRFQCEQSPPSPLKPLQDEAEGPLHRPVFRPEVDDPKHPLADDIPFDSRPFETTRPERPYDPYRPYKPPYLNHVDRPDDYNGPQVDLNRPPSYGLHRPQEIPYRPERPFQNNSYNDPYDVLHFDGRPQYSGSIRPDPHYPPHPSDDIPDIYGPKPIRPHRPNLPPLRPEQPEYIYITRPNRKPSRPQDDTLPDYGNKPTKPVDYPTKPDPYGPNDDPRPPYKPTRPIEYPYRPYDRPSYDYNSQYASSYGQNQYNDNSIYVEIYDPPRPYKPSKPPKDRPVYGSSQGYGPNYGYGSHNDYNSYSQSSYGQSSHSQNSQSQYYGSSSITQLDNYNRPIDSGNKPYKPQNVPNSGYGQDSARPEKPYERPSSGYGSQEPPDYKPQRPAYGTSNSGYGSSQSSNFDQSYGSQSSGYGSQTTQKPLDPYQKPSYSEKPAYDSNKPSYGSQGSYGSSQGTYGSNQASYGTTQSSYGSPSQQQSQGYHSSQQSSYGSQSVDNFQGSYGGNRPSNTRPSYDDYRPSYDDNRPGYGGSSYGRPPVDDIPSYGNRPSRPVYDDKPSYNRPLYDERPSYDGNRPSYDSNRPGYGDMSYDKPIQDINKPSYGNKPTRPEYNDKPSYGLRPDDNKPSYGSRPVDTPSYDNKPTYGSRPDDKPSYGNKPTYDNKPSYGTSDDKPYDNRPSYNQPAYDNDRPDGDLGSYGSDGGYGAEDYKNSKPKPNRTDSYDRPVIKPVYEYELEKPSNVPSYIVRPNGEVITSRPVVIGDYGGRPAYGREPPISYKACFRRVLAGKRALRSFVRRVVPCERLEDCRRECAEERRFHCESFNYRLDPSFRGKGLCEMMTKPIEAFNIRQDFVEDKDYDFYELDRNSLEPHCPETLRGPGLLHSGFLSSKPNKESYQNSWDRNDYSDRGYDRNYNRFYEDRRGDRNYGGGRRRYEDQFFVPYQIGLARSNEDQDTWGQYGGSYGNSYYKDRNDYHKSINHWGLNDLEPPVYGVRPLVNQNFNYHDLSKKVDRYGYGSWKRGRWNTSGASGSGNGLDYGESSYYKPPKPVFYESTESHERSDEVVVKDCTSRRRPGMSLGSGAIRRSLLARTVVQCEAACFNEREFKCVSYSYRYSNSHGSDNCFLSERPYRGLELSADSGSDVYAMPEDHSCSVISNKPFVESECFWHVRSGAAVSGSAVRAALTVAGLGACEAECIRAHAFFCRGFSFRFDSPTIGDDLENCILTSTPPTSLDSGRGLRPTAGHELYARGNYGRGCEPALYDDVHHGETGECYLQYDAAAKLIGTAIKGQARVKDERSCGQACTDAPFRCLSFSYNNNAPPDTDNCLLSEIRLFDLQRGVDYEHSTDDWLFAFDLFNGQCWRKVHGRGDYDQPVPELPRPLSLPPPETYSSSHPSSPSGPSSGPSGPSGYLPGPPAPAEPYLPVSGPPSGPSYKPYPDSRPDFKPSYPGPGYPAEPPGYLPKPRPEYEPSGPYRPSGPSGPRPSGPAYLPTGGSAPGYPSGPFRPSGPPSGPFRPDPPTGSYRPIPPSESYRPDVPSGPYRPGSDRPGYPDTAYGPPPVRPGPPRPPGLRPGDREEEPIAVSWRHYTVSGFPCRKGTTCAQNQVAGHWACEPEGGEIGSWDYCCAPTHRCGYSEGFHKPWCYVGPSKDQWRPCSEKYYPYHQHNIPHPSQGHRGPGPDSPRLPPNRPPPSNFDRPDLSYLPEADRRYWDDLYNNGPQAYYDKYGNPLPGYTRVPTADRPYIKYRHNYPRPESGHWVPVSTVPGESDPLVPGGLGAPRYWPVAYLHKSPPPNTTYFKYNQTDRPTPSSTTERYDIHPPPSRDVPREPSPPSRDTNGEPSPSFRDNSRDPSPSFRDTPREPPASRELSRDRTPARERPPTSFANVNPDRPPNNKIDNKNHRDEKTRNITNVNEDIFNLELDKVTTTTTKVEIKEVTEAPKANESKAEVEAVKVVEAEKAKVDKELDNLKGIDDKIDDFSSSIEVLDIEDAKKGEKSADLKTLEAEERQIEAIGRLLAARRGGKLVLEKRSQKDLETKSIALDKDFVDFNFGNKFPTATERRGTVQRVTKDEIQRERNIDKSLEVSETTFVRPPRVLSTTENIRKAVVNGKVFYSASVREQRDLINNSTRKAKSLNLRPLEERAPSVIANNNYGKKKVIRARNVNPVRKVRRVYRRKYNPEEVRRRLLERERSMKENADNKKE